MNNKKNVLIIIGIAIAAFVITFLGISLTKNIGKSESTISTENANEKIVKMMKKINLTEADPVKSPVEFNEVSEADELPDIEKNDITVNNTTDLYAEIFATAEKAGNGKDGWLNEVAKSFNEQGYEVNGNPVSVKIRNVASGLGMDYIRTGKYVPDGYSPSNDFWEKMLEADGVKMQTVTDRLVSNTPGILLSKETNKSLMDKYGSINLQTVVEATTNGEFVMGYTNPYASATGMNFLISTLKTYDPSNPLSETAIEGFQKFQKNVPFVAYTTLQMREAAESGTLDGFILEYQTYINDPELARKYIFTPFGYDHKNPLFAPEGIDAEKLEILNKFADYASQDEWQMKATDYGFNSVHDYICELSDVDGSTLIQSQEIWKTEKDSGKPIIAVFVADVSGSMDGEPLNALKLSLINGMQYIGKKNYVGLVSYSNDVTVNVPIGKFDLNQMSLFKGAVENLSASGGTATFDAIVVATDMLQKAQEQYPEAKTMMFVLSDGQSNRGLSLSDVSNVLESLKIPVYTIGYNADIDALGKISAINEAASINADSDDVVYKLKNLFNSSL